MKDDSKPDEIKNDDNTDEKKDIRINDADINERDIDKELERVESIEGGKDDVDSVEVAESTEEKIVGPTVESVSEFGAETVAPKPTIEEIIGKNAEQSPKNKKPLSWILICIVLLLALAGLAGYYFYDKMSQDQTVANLKTQLSDVDQQKQAAVNQLASLKAAQTKAENEAKAQDDVEYREIPELGVRYKVTDVTKDQIYAAFPKSQDQVTVAFSTLALSSVVEKSKTGSVNEYPCSLNSSGPQSISYYKDPNAMVGVEGSEKAAVSKAGKKVGEGYFYFTAAQAACSDKLADVQAANLKSVEDIYKSLEVIPVE
jgi:hypothetical protein